MQRGHRNYWQAERPAINSNRQQATACNEAVCSSSISGTSGSGSQSFAYSRHSGDRGFDSTLGHPGEDLGSVSTNSSQMGGGSGNGSTPVTPTRDSARVVRARARAVFVARKRAAQAELEQFEQREEQQAVALISPSTVARQPLRQSSEMLRMSCRGSCSVHHCQHYQ